MFMFALPQATGDESGWFNSLGVMPTLPHRSCKNWRQDGLGPPDHRPHQASLGTLIFTASAAPLVGGTPRNKSPAIQ